MIILLYHWQLCESVHRALRYLSLSPSPSSFVTLISDCSSSSVASNCHSSIIQQFSARFHAENYDLSTSEKCGCTLPRLFACHALRCSPQAKGWVYGVRSLVWATTSIRCPLLSVASASYPVSDSLGTAIVELRISDQFARASVSLDDRTHESNSNECCVNYFSFAIPRSRSLLRIFYYEFLFRDVQFGMTENSIIKVFF